MRRSTLLLVASMLSLCGFPFPLPPASASCAAPYLTDAEDLVLRRDASVSVEGRAFAEGCRDSMSCTGGIGCEDCEYDDPPPTPMENVGLRLVQRNHSWRLAVSDARTADENELGWVTWTFRVPGNVQPGRAKLVPDSGEPALVLIR